MTGKSITVTSLICVCTGGGGGESGPSGVINKEGGGRVGQLDLRTGH